MTNQTGMHTTKRNVRMIQEKLCEVAQALGLSVR